ncbi:MAG: bifunctional phosphoribosylaminoimidazolecarboxamide formyltransferase/IMP cyclohydrolase [Bacillota bacterium]|nr:bifunctional phosphoribosylaminoimidazolecarboxamide formyltransferase/IMP cyclohydrolase [Bacillota bacterium]HHU43553.1 bifunctional phosphoribosylaminoimidazolecarboxamide formyltransferase/IMP cyclohydrolase [Clostridiales bacterium]
MKKRALISVSNKTGITQLAKSLTDLRYEIISTGGTAKILKDNGIKVIGISEITGFPECLDGRVKTLHPNVHAGLLAMRKNPEHIAQLKALNINTIDIVVVNLYPFKNTIMKEGVEFQEAVENIDIGGPTMLRSAAKNYQDVAAIVDPKDYDKVIKELEENGEVSLETKMYLMYKVYQHTACYDTLIASYLRERIGIEYPDEISFAYEKAQDMRYGENPHQTAVFYKEPLPVRGALTQAKQLNGKELSFNNINDANGALELLKEFDRPAVVAVKHANPCGVAEADSVYEAYMKAYEGDPVSIFGGIVAANGEVDKETAEQMVKIFLEIVIAPSFSKEALDILKTKQNLRVLELKDIDRKITNNIHNHKKVLGGLLVQSYDIELIEELKTVTKKSPSPKEIEDMLFAMKVVKHTKSNAIVVAKDKATLGIGAGQTNRIWAAKQAIEHSGEKVRGAVMASDAFFPFNDCVEEAAKAGITAIIQPGGSIRDQDSIDLCNQKNISMIFSAQRHFKH